MARGTTLTKLLSDLRAETRRSRNPAHNVSENETQINTLQRVQERLWSDFTWPHLRVKRDILLQAGQRAVDLPADLDIERIEKVEVFTDGRWLLVGPGIGAAELTAYNSDLDQRAWPPTRWQITESEDVELWPIPDRNGDADTLDGTLRFTGIRTLSPLIAGDDRCDLDDRMIVLYAAAEILAASGAKDAQLKLAQADKIYAKKRGGLCAVDRIRMFAEPSCAPRRLVVTTYRPPAN